MKYNERMLPRIEAWAAEGLTDGQIAINLGVNITTFAFWKRMRPEVALLLEKAREPVIREVENALYKRAVGYRTKEVTVEKTRGRKTVKRTMKEIAPDVKAQIFYLTNRNAKKWRFSSKIETTSTNETESPIDVSKMNDEQLAMLSEALLEAHGEEE